MPVNDADLQNFRSIQDLLASFYGGALVTQPEETDYTIGAGTIPIGAKVNGLRIGAIISNTGATNISVSFKSPLTVTTGIMILPGRYYRFDWYYDGDLVQRPLFAISSAGGGTLHMLERFLTGA